MRAARLHEHGGPLRVEDVAGPRPGSGEVEVDLLFAGVNPVDRYTAAGSVAPDGPLPRTLGGEGAGLLDGRLVAVTGGGLGASRDGTYAEQVAVPRDAVIEVPDGVAPEQAACIGVAGITAWSVVVELAHVGPGDRVLVLGAGGGVGLPIVSLAAGLGATVVGQVGRAAKAAAVRDAGADHVLVADADGLAAAAGDHAPTVVVDPLGGAFAPAALGLLAARGRMVVYGTSAGADVQLGWQTLYRNSISVLGYGGIGLSPVERGERGTAALRALAEGRMRIPVERAVPLEQAQQAFDDLGNRSVTGKIVLDCR